MSARLRYAVLAISCLIHATFLAELIRKENKPHAESLVWRILDACSFAPAWVIGLSLLCLWPIWIFLLWKFGVKNKVAVLIPTLIGLIIMWPVWAELFMALLMSTGFARM